jgi:hypothetical protein
MLTLFFEALQANMSSRRQQFPMPVQWPKQVARSTATLHDKLVLFTGHPIVFEIMDALWTDRFWISKDTDLFDETVRLVKRLLHFAYDVHTGRLDLRRVVEALSFGKAFDCGVPMDQCWARADGLDTADIVHDNHVSLWTLLRAMYCDEALQYVIKKVHPERHVPSMPLPDTIYDTVAYNVDAFLLVLRCCACLTGAMQRYHVELLRHLKQTNKEPDWSALKIEYKEIKPVKIQKSKAWNNYLFDLHAMWLTLFRIRKALCLRDPIALYKYLAEARAWFRTSGFASSVTYLYQCIKEDLLRPMIHVGTLLMNLYLKLWTHARVMFDHSRKVIDIQFDLQLISERVFLVFATKSFLPSRPNAGTAIWLRQDNNQGTTNGITNISFHQFGLAPNESSDGILGTYLEDIQVSSCAGLVAETIMKSMHTAWLSLTRLDLWDNPEIHKQLPTLQVIQDRIQTVSLPWFLDAADLVHENQTICKQTADYYKEKDKHEVDKLVAELEIK